jgi:hypothetical protein
VSNVNSNTHRLLTDGRNLQISGLDGRLPENKILICEYSNFSKYGTGFLFHLFGLIPNRLPNVIRISISNWHNGYEESKNHLNNSKLNSLVVADGFSAGPVVGL